MTLAYMLLSTALLYHILYLLDYPVLSIPELLWNILVYIMPTPLLLALDKRSRGATQEAEGKTVASASQGHAAKSDAMRRILGLGTTGLFSNFQRGRSLSGISSTFRSPSRDALPGLGNWDNSCYQNSVIQGLASLLSFSAFLNQFQPFPSTKGPFSTSQALRDILKRLNDPSNAGQKLWTPTELKSMSSWQQQDAQEYYSKVLDEVEREFEKDAQGKSKASGLVEVKDLLSDVPNVQAKDLVGESKARTCRPPWSNNDSSNLRRLPDELASMSIRNPLEGLLAQRVGCLKCKHVEGLSLIPFNCLTVPLGKHWIYDIRACLDDYTGLEPIGGVECSKCTLLHRKQQLEQLLAQIKSSSKEARPTALPSSPSILLSSVQNRLRAVSTALLDDDFSENTLLKKCQIPANNRVSTTKSRQAVIARAPQSLVIHVNRSVFDEITGVQSKNFANVEFPKNLDLGPWCLGGESSNGGKQTDIESWDIDPSESMLPDVDIEELEDAPPSNYSYTLRAVITHYGRHENGHYICYRARRDLVDRSPCDVYDDGQEWWRLSDEDVSKVSEDIVLAQGGVFMLFYEKLSVLKEPKKDPYLDIIHQDVAKLVTGKTELDEATLESVRPVASDAIAPLEALTEANVNSDDLIPSATIPERPPGTLKPALEVPLSETQNRTRADDIKNTVSSRTESPFENTDPKPEGPEPEIARFDSPMLCKDNQQVAPRMRTAGPHMNRNSSSRAGKGISLISSMVTAN